MKLSKAFLYLVSIVALASCSTFTTEDKEIAEDHLKIGTSLLQAGQYPQALQSLLQAEKLDPSSPAIQNALGVAYFVRERYELAEKHLRNAISLKADYSDAKNNLGRVLIDMGKPNEALGLLKQVLNDLTYPTPEKPLISTGIALFKLKRFSEAKDNFLRAINIQRDNCEAHSYFGRSLFEMRDYYNAIESLDRAIGFCQVNQYDEPHYYSALAYFEIGKKRKAQNRLEELIKIYPNGLYVERAKTMLETLKR